MDEKGNLEGLFDSFDGGLWSSRPAAPSRCSVGLGVTALSLVGGNKLMLEMKSEHAEVGYTEVSRWSRGSSRDSRSNRPMARCACTCACS